MRPFRILAAIRTALVAALVPGLLLLAGTAAAQDSYRIQPGDVLRIEVIEDPTLNRSVLVSPDGRISVPLAGSVRASGRSLDAVQSELVAALTPNFASAPNVFVGLESLAPEDDTTALLPTGPIEEPTIDIFVIGEANAPGNIEVAPGTTVLQGFAEMGGFTRFAATGRIQLRRTDPHGAETVYTLDYDAMLSGTSPNGSARLRDGDVIIVPERGLFE